MKKKSVNDSGGISMSFMKKNLLKMKLTFLCLFLSFVQLMANDSFSQSTRVTLNLKDARVEDVLMKIEEQSKLFFIYNRNVVDVNRIVNISCTNQKVSEILNGIFSGTDVDYEVQDRHIILKSSSEPISQTKSISGKVTDSSGSSLPGVSVVVKGTTTGTITDANGSYSLSNIPSNGILQFSFVGMKTQEVAIGSKTTINVSLAEETVGIEEVVAVGYATRAKGDLTGAVTKIGKEVFKSKTVTNAMDALQGVLPGVTITRASGQPGSEGFNVQIRGFSSINGNKPMILIDGVPGDINVINPNDIADVTVLKDAAAAIYGARAADGVILITTKKGESGKTAVLYSFNLGVKTPHYLKKMANTRQLAEMYDEGIKNVGQPGLSQEVFDKINSNSAPDVNGGWMKYLENFPGFYGNTDWTKVVYGNSLQQMHNLSISGGNGNNTFLVSAGYERNEGTFNYGENYADRYNLRLKYDFSLFKKLKLETSTTYDQLNTIEPSMLGTAIYGLSRSWSYLPVKTPDGHFYKYQGYTNPASVLEEGGTGKANYSKFATNLKATLDLATGLKIIGQASVDVSFWRKNTIYKKFVAYNWDDSEKELYNNPNSSGYENSYTLYKTYTSFLEYKKSFGDHSINVLGGGSYEHYYTEGQNIWGKNYSNNYLFTLNLADKTKLEYTTSFGGNASESALASSFGQLGYNYKHKLFLDMSLRKDGSSKFTESKRWSDLYPSVSTGWKISEENFMKGITVISSLKIRGSWGRAGNQEINFGNYDYIPLLYIYGNYPIGSPNVGLQGAESGIASGDRSWETIETKNAGVDFSLFKSRLNGSFDSFVKKNNDMLVYVERPAVFGGNAPTSNSGKLLTKGWELSLGWSDKINDVKYVISASISDSKNKLLEIAGSDSYNEGIVWARQGYSLNSIFGYEFSGIIQNQEQLNEYKKLEGIPSNIGIGDAMYKDIDGDGKITAFGNPDKSTKGDMKYLGNKIPRYSYSANIDLSYKGFSLSMLWQGVGERNTIRTGDFAQPYYWVWHQPLEYFYGKNWTPDNANAKYPRIIPGGIGYDNLRDWNGRISSNRIEDVSYLRLKQIRFGYNVQEQFCKRIGIAELLIYVSGKDLLTISKGTWNNSFDPEEDRSDWLSEVTYPFNKVLSLGVDIKF